MSMGENRKFSTLGLCPDPAQAKVSIAHAPRYHFPAAAVLQLRMNSCGARRVLCKCCFLRHLMIRNLPRPTTLLH